MRNPPESDRLDAAAPVWPPIQLEPRPWQRPGDEFGSRRQLRRATGEYFAAAPPRIARAGIALNPEVLAAADEASHALARFDAEAGAFTAPFAALLLRSESAASSEVEHLTAGAKQVALAELGASRSENAKLIVANGRAMNAAIRLSAELDVRTIIAMHDALLRESAPHFVGDWREEQVWIGGGAISPHGADYVAPHHERVPELMDDLVDFANRDDVPILAQAAIAHAQFETIHPFPDGNGRTGRALIHAMLRRGGLTKNLTVPVSAGLLRDPLSYFQALGSYRAGDVDAAVDVLTQAVFGALNNGRHLVDDIRDIRAGWAETVRARADSSAYRALDTLLAHPMVTASSLASLLGVSTVAATNAIAQLTEAGVLTQAAGSARYRIWQASEIIGALDTFAERARRGRI